MNSLYCFDSYEVPAHTQDSLVNYLMHGLQPGGFVTAVLANDLMRACRISDPANSENLSYIAQWVQDQAPPNSWGDYETVTAWLNDTDQRRTRYADAMEKRAMWKILSK